MIYRAITLPDGRPHGLTSPGSTLLRYAVVACDGSVVNGRCTSCFKYIATTIPMHFTHVVLLESAEEDRA